MIPPSVGSIARRLPGKVGTALGMTNLITHNQSAQREMLDLVDRFVVLSEWARNVLICQRGTAGKISLNRLGVRFPSSRGAMRVTQVRRSPWRISADSIRSRAWTISRMRLRWSRDPQPIRFEFHGPVQYMHRTCVVTRLKSIVGPDAWVTFGGELDAAGVRALLNRIDVVCCPSRVVEGGRRLRSKRMPQAYPSSDLRFPRSPSSFATVDGRLYPPGECRARWRRFSPTCGESRAR